VLAFQDRYRAMPGDYDKASTTIPCSGGCLNGNGNGRVEAGTDGAIHEDILAWQHMSDAGFLRDRYVMDDPSISDPTTRIVPRACMAAICKLRLISGGVTPPTRCGATTSRPATMYRLRSWQRSIARSMMDCPAAAVSSSRVMPVQARPRSAGSPGAALQRILPLVSGSPRGITVAARRCCANDDCKEDSMNRSDVPITIWTREARSVVEATAKALGKGHYQVDFVDSAGNVLNVLRLSETAMLGSRRAWASSQISWRRSSKSPDAVAKPHQECCQ
jgi:hypothetical protein